MELLLGIDIGGTKTAVSLSKAGDSSVEIVAKAAFDSIQEPAPALEKIAETAERLALENSAKLSDFSAIGVSCGGIIDSARGVVIATPVLPLWQNVEAGKFLSERLRLPAFILNDANACAVAEWKYGAGAGSKNMVFLTCGTGIGAGIILNGALVEGAGGAAGEFGHIRSEPFGPAGCGKSGSLEGFCSGTGIAALAKIKALELFQSGKKCAFCAGAECLESISAKSVADAAISGDDAALEVYETAGDHLGRGLAILIDLLNPEIVAVGSVFARAEKLLRPAMERAIAREAMPYPRSLCAVVPAKLGENVGDIAAACAALDGMENFSKIS